MNSSPSELYFATSGIRGEANTVISPELGLRIGRAVASWVKEDNSSKNAVYIGYDTRRNSHSIASTIVAGLSSLGVDSKLFARPVPTPAVIFSTVRNDSAAGIMVTGSHLPRDQNGIILFDKNGNYYKGLLPESKLDPVSWDKLGKIENITAEIEDYERFLKNIANSQFDGEIKWDILIDPVHGPMKSFLEKTLKPYFQNIIRFNWEADDTFSGRLSEPTPENLMQTSEAVMISECDLGIATDMDGDRVIFITKKGEVISGDYIGAILSKYYWKEYPDKPVVAPINTSAIIEYMAEQEGGKLEYCKVGPPSIIEKMQEENAKFGFEETGKYFFFDYAIWPDSAISSIMLIAFLQLYNTNLIEILNNMPVLHATKSKIESKREHGDLVMQEVRSEINSYFNDVKNINDMDGLRINFNDKSWLLIRPSGTEDYIRIFSEHSTKEKNDELNNKGKTIVKNVLSKLNL